MSTQWDIIMTDIKSLVAAQKAAIVDWRRTLHRIPETGYTEKKTSAFIAEQLSRFGLEVTTGIARFGVVGLMSGNAAGESNGKTVLIRSDMDALPVKEETGLPFTSTHDGAMHACGHDGHMAMVLGTALVLNSLKEKISGQVKFLFQPAEEGPGGAKPMIEEGVMENPHVDYSIGGHLWPALPEGTVGVKEGPLMAAMDRFDLTISGKGGHGAMPHMCIDPIDTGVQVVNALQRIVSRRMNPLNPTVVTVGSFHGGSTFNIIPDTVKMSGTTRTFDRDIWQSWPERMETVVRGVCESMGATYELDYQQGYPPTINDAEMADMARRCAIQAVGEDKVVVPEATMGGEDMSFFLEASKGCYLFLGAGREGSAPLHNCRFDFNENVLLTGVETYCRMILELLK
jgi:amidohydrolase